MKKTLLSLLFIYTVVAANAQVSNMSWPSTAVLPETHDWSIGFDVVPVISAAGNLFHSSSNNDSIFSQQQYTLVGLYLKDDKTAYRLRVRIGFSSLKNNNLVTDDVNPSTQLTDTWTENTTNITIGGGIQKWIGKGRLRGIYGWEAAVMLGAHSQTFTYGNPFTETDQTPTSTNFSLPLAGGGFATNDSASRPLTLKDGFMFGFQLNGYIGVEYFFAPKMSLSAEYGWGLSYTSTGQATLTYETWTGGSGGNETTNNTNIAKNSAFVLDVQNAASIIFHLYF
jgi:hypothetical protein